MTRTPNKLTDAEIKKALEHCVTGDLSKSQIEVCEPCPYFECGDCTFQLKQNALDQINHLEGVNEKNENIIRVADKTIATLQAENESLKAEVERLNKSINHMKGAKCVYSYDGETLEFCTTSPCPISKTVDQIKTEAYKEFAERLNKEFSQCQREYRNVLNSDGACAMIIAKKVTNNLLNELVGDLNGKDG